jgi:hypothetical protein
LNGFRKKTICFLRGQKPRPNAVGTAAPSNGVCGKYIGMFTVKLLYFFFRSLILYETRKILFCSQESAAEALLSVSCYMHVPYYGESQFPHLTLSCMTTPFWLFGIPYCMYPELPCICIYIYMYIYIYIYKGYGVA